LPDEGIDVTKASSTLTNVLWALFAVCAVLGSLLDMGSAVSIVLWAIALGAAAAVLIISRRSTAEPD
jgi:hypothetical protein